MQFLLNNQRRKVLASKKLLIAAMAMDLYRTTNAKANIRSLLSSPKGIATSFGAGFTKHRLSSSSSSSSLKGPLIKLLSFWLTSQSAEPANADPTPTVAEEAA